jgi:ribonucleoside-diphosphate reductase alpha chain
MLLDHSRDALFTAFGKATLKDRYLLPGESFQDLFARVAKAYSDDEDHAQRIYDYMSKHWFMPATPILSNGGTDRGLPISCFLNRVEDSMPGIAERWNENVFLASGGGGLGTYYGDVRSIKEKVGRVGETSGVISFLRVNDALVDAVSQGSLRRGSGAVYLPVNHPEIEEFVDIRRPTGDPNRRTPNLHHGIVLDEAFKKAVENDEEYPLVSPKTGDVLKRISAQDLWQKILISRLETGEPYLIFSDAVREGRPEAHKTLGLEVVQSNLCTEITLPTGRDHLGNNRTAVCCLSSVNLEYYDEWELHPLFINDVMRFLDNVMSDFIRRASLNSAYRDAVYSAQRERSIGIGVMGFQTYLQKKRVPYESYEAAVINRMTFAWLKKQFDENNVILGEQRGSCPDNIDAGVVGRFVNVSAIAPTASISTIAGNTSPGIEQWPANVFTQKGLSGSFTVVNRELANVLRVYNLDNEETWKSILLKKGSVQHIEQLTDRERRVFKTAWETDQFWTVMFSNDRAPYVSQGQSVNLFLESTTDKQRLHDIHMAAWNGGSKSLYYLRSLSVRRAESENLRPNHLLGESPKPEECEACQ